VESQAVTISEGAEVTQGEGIPVEALIEPTEEHRKGRSSQHRGPSTAQEPHRAVWIVSERGRRPQTQGEHGPQDQTDQGTVRNYELDSSPCDHAPPSLARSATLEHRRSERAGRDMTHRAATEQEDEGGDRDQEGRNASQLRELREQPWQR
jgi:hypothetical protein